MSRFLTLMASFFLLFSPPQAYQVIGVQEDGTARIALSDIDCSDLDEGDLNEFTGIVCRGRPIDQGRNFSTLIDGKWHTVNQQVDFNEDGKIEGGQWTASAVQNGRIIRGENSLHC
jgi:hypothetical protein